MPPAPTTFRDCLVLTGPTGSGKSALGLEFAAHIGAEIIALDSMTLYRGMDIGTAKPTAAERARVPHHLIDVLDPWESASVAWYLERAAEAVQDIHRRGRRVLFVGGTPFYLKALLFGLFESPPVDAEYRARLESVNRDGGAAKLHAQLSMCDPLSAARLHPNDVKRVIRALEVFQLTGQPLSAKQTQWSGDEVVTIPVFCLEMPREDLYRRIDRRVREMVEAGWLDEVRRLRSLPRPLSREAGQALGYRELAAVLEGTQTLEAAIERIQRGTRQFAKRQLTWFRHLKGLRFVSPDLTLLRQAAKIE